MGKTHANSEGKIGKREIEKNKTKKYRKDKCVCYVEEEEEENK